MEVHSFDSAHLCATDAAPKAGYDDCADGNMAGLLTYMPTFQSFLVNFFPVSGSVSEGPEKGTA